MEITLWIKTSGTILFQSWATNKGFVVLINQFYHPLHDRLLTRFYNVQKNIRVLMIPRCIITLICNGSLWHLIYQQETVLSGSKVNSWYQSHINGGTMSSGLIRNCWSYVNIWVNPEYLLGSVFLSLLVFYVIIFMWVIGSGACTKSGSLRFSQFSGCWLILSVYIIMSFDFPVVRLFGVW